MRMRTHHWYLDAIASATPRPFVQRLLQRLPNLYAAAADTVNHDPMVAPEFAQILIGHARSFYVQTEFQRAGQSAGLAATIDRTPAGYPFTLVRAGQFLFTVAASPSIGDTPRPADFREDLAALNAFSDAPKLPTFVAEEMYQPGAIYTIVYHVPVTATAPSEYRRTLGYLGVGIPNKKMTDWLFTASMQAIFARQQEATSEIEPSQRDSVNPKPRKIADEGRDH